MIRGCLAGRIALTVLGLGLLAACAAPPVVREARAPVEEPQMEAAIGDEVADGPVAAAYRLGAGDRIRLTVFRHEDLSGKFEIDGEGAFTMPLVGPIAALGLTPREVERRIEEELTTQGYLVEPKVSIEVLNYRPFYVLGEVRNPGSYPYADGMSVITAVTLAGGFSQRAVAGEVTLIRGGFNGRTITAGLDTGILPGDIIEVPERLF
jgi:protein involved in polysaccharide export with SLBB domain